MAYLIRFLLVFVFFYLLYRVFKIIAPLFLGKSVRRFGLPSEDEGRLVKDPQCQIHIPERNALSAEVGGQVYYFCSLECLKQFRRQKTGTKSQT